MSRLSAYKSKRKLAETPEPKPKRRITKRKKDLIFVVQKHNASHLHYDLRLELDGVLKSWAVPKGPPKSSSEKRLAIMVEDHPYEYKDFKGVIPKGNYGAGVVEIWDKGTYIITDTDNITDAQAYMRTGLKKGHVRFVLKGEKLKGEFSLVRTSRQGSENAWLLLKKASPESSIDPSSSLGPSSSVDPSSSPRRRGSRRVADTLDSRLRGKDKFATIPTSIKPMLAQLIEKPFNKKDWLFEIKWDGYRAVSVIHQNKVQLISRNQKSFNDQFSDVVEDLKIHIKYDAILDGEIVVLNDGGRSEFQLIQNYNHEKRGVLRYYVFDLLYYNGQDLRERPLIERKEILELLLAPLKKSRIRYSDHIEAQGIKFFKEAKKLGLEGIVAKRAQSTYQMKRSADWLKIKTHHRQEVVIGGFTAPRGSREKFGALLVGIYEGKKLNYVGHVGTGFSEETLKSIAKKMAALTQASCPFVLVPKTNSPATFVKPQLVCEVSFTEWTKDGVMRHPVFEGLRTDKRAKAVSKERAEK